MSAAAMVRYVEAHGTAVERRRCYLYAKHDEAQGAALALVYRKVPAAQA